MDLSSGYRSTVTSSRLSAPLSSPCAGLERSGCALGSLSSSGVALMPAALARAFGHLRQHGALLGREALDRLHQVRDEVGAALVDVLHLRPLLVDVLLAAPPAGC